VTIIVNPPATNTRPVVNAGPNQTISFGQPATLNGTVTDDGQPNPPGTVTLIWYKVSGPGWVRFGNATSLTTTATFTQAGTYVLALSASDSRYTSEGRVTITVVP